MYITIVESSVVVVAVVCVLFKSRRGWRVDRLECVVSLYVFLFFISSSASGLGFCFGLVVIVVFVLRYLSLLVCVPRFGS